MPYAAKQTLIGTVNDFVANGSYFTKDKNTYWVDQLGIDVNGEVLSCQIVSLKDKKNQNDIKIFEQYQFNIKTFTKGEYTLEWIRPYTASAPAAQVKTSEAISKTAMMSARAAALNSAVNLYATMPLPEDTYGSPVAHSPDDVLKLAEKFAEWISK